MYNNNNKKKKSTLLARGNNDTVISNKTKQEKTRPVKTRLDHIVGRYQLKSNRKQEKGINKQITITQIQDIRSWRREKVVDGKEKSPGLQIPSYACTRSDASGEVGRWLLDWRWLTSKIEWTQMNDMTNQSINRCHAIKKEENHLHVHCQIHHVISTWWTLNRQCRSLSMSQFWQQILPLSTPSKPQIP